MQVVMNWKRISLLLLVFHLSGCSSPELRQKETSPDEISNVSPQGITSPSSIVAVNSDLIGSAWSLYQFGSPQDLSLAFGEQVPTISFQTNGHVSGSTGCNRFTGDFSTDDFRIQFDSIAVSKKMCSGQSGLLEQEQTILKTIETAGRYQIDDGKLSIFSSGDEQILIFKK